MQIFYDDDGEKMLVDGEYLKKSILRSDLVPIPMTLEVDVRVEIDSIQFFKEGKQIHTGNGDEFTIIKSEVISSGKIQGGNMAQYMSITAVLSAFVNACFVKDRSIRKVKTSLVDIYRSIGCKLSAVDGDFTVPVFNCLSGEPPSFQIAAILQESAGVICWRDGRLVFRPLADLFKQEAITDLPIISAESVSSGFLERHEIPTFYSIDAAGEFIYGNKSKARSARFVADKDIVTLRNMSTCLVLKQVSRISYNENIVAGDLIQVSADEQLVVITAAHVYSVGMDGDAPRQYTKLWLGELHK